MQVVSALDFMQVVSALDFMQLVSAADFMQVVSALDFMQVVSALDFMPSGTFLCPVGLLFAQRDFLLPSGTSLCPVGLFFAQWAVECPPNQASCVRVARPKPPFFQSSWSLSEFQGLSVVQLSAPLIRPAA